MEGWNHFAGNDCPASPDSIVEVVNESGETLVARAGDLCWSRDMDVEGRIVMWRPAVNGVMRLAMLAAYEGTRSVMPRVLAVAPC